MWPQEWKKTQRTRRNKPKSKTLGLRKRSIELHIWLDGSFKGYLRLLRASVRRPLKEDRRVKAFENASICLF